MFFREKGLLELIPEDLYVEAPRTGRSSAFRVDRFAVQNRCEKSASVELEEHELLPAELPEADGSSGRRPGAC